jgi:hypothetical protein
VGVGVCGGGICIDGGVSATTTILLRSNATQRRRKKVDSGAALSSSAKGGMHAGVSISNSFSSSFLVELNRKIEVIRRWQLRIIIGRD